MRGTAYGLPVATVGELARPVASVQARLPCVELDNWFRGDPRLPCVVVRDDERVGMIGRQAFAQLMSGPFGYGRALWEKMPVGRVADWNPLIVPAQASVTYTCERARRRDHEHRYDDVLIVGPGGDLHRLSAASLFEALAQLMAEQAISDSLSGLANRAYFLDHLDAASHDETGDRLLVVYLDLDRMKQVNDALGHNAGDRLILSTARRLTAAAEPGDLVARLGGDEFAVLRRIPASMANAAVASAVGNRFRSAIANPDPWLPPAAHSRASVGVAVGGPRVDGHTLLTEADMAMYRAKQAGGDTVRVVTGVGAHLDNRHPGAGHGLARAISSGELRLYYQPIVDLVNEQVISVEALLRWEHPRHGLLTPDAFFSDAERANELPTLDGWILTRACADLAAWDAELGVHAPRLINVNLTVDTLRVNDIYRRAMDALDVAGLDTVRLCIELPEAASLTVMTDVIPSLQRLRDSGVGITLDDMGAGSATLRHLSVLPLTGIKIDKLFIGGMLENRCDHAVVKFLTDLGNDLGLTVTAEGVEQPEQLDALFGLGVPRAQGYLLGRPMPADELVRLLAPAASVGGRHRVAGV